MMLAPAAVCEIPRAIVLTFLLAIAFLSTGLMEDSYHLERMSTMATMVLAAMTQ